MLATLLTILAQRGTQEPPDEGIGIGLIILIVLVIAALAVALLMVFRKVSKRERTGPPAQPHEPGHVGRRESV
jgi:hypothetical protein